MGAVGRLDVDPHELVGKDIIIEYRLHVDKVVTLRFCDVIKGHSPDGKPYNLALDSDGEYIIREVVPMKWWQRLFCPGSKKS